MRGSPRSGKRRSPAGPRPPWWKLEDADWRRLEPLLVDPPRRTHNPGRKRYPPRAIVEGLLYLLVTGVRYVDLPRELGFPSGETCRRRLHEWIESGVWAQALTLLVSELDQQGRLDWSRVVVDASIVDAKKGAIWSGRARSTAAFRPVNITL